MPTRPSSAASTAARGVPGRPWTDEENDLVAADYFAMLDKQLRGESLNKAEHNRNLQRLIPARNHKAIEYKHQNISFVLEALGLPRLDGYRPARNIQSSLTAAVLRALPARGELAEQLVLGAEPQPLEIPSRAAPAPGDPILALRPAPAAAETPAGGRKQSGRLVRRIDWAVRDRQKRRLGQQGEERVLVSERARLRAADRADLARKVRWVAAEDGDGAGYDILSYCRHGEERLLEVKTTTGDPRTPFHLSANERACAAENPGRFRIVRVYDFLRRPAMFRLRPPLEDAVRLEPTAYRATPY